MIAAVIEWTDVASAWSDIAMAVVSLLTLGGVVYVAIQVGLQRKQIHRDLENMYVERYWTIMDRFDAAAPGTPERERAVRAYLALSEDQCDLRADDRVTSETWRLWGQSIFGALRSDEYREVLTAEPIDRFVRLREMLGGGVEYDPINMSKRRQKSNGL